MLNPLSREKIKNVNFKITESDWQQVLKLSKKYAGGNASAWIRYAILREGDKGKAKTDK